MKLNLHKHTAVDMLMADSYANWTYAEAEAIYDYLEELEESMDEEITFDRVAIRCDFRSVTLDEIRKDYDDAPENKAELMDWLYDRTTVIEPNQDDTLIIGAF